jgi:hypothetical protein
MAAIAKSRFCNFWLARYTIKCDKTPNRPTAKITLATNRNLPLHEVGVALEP